MAGILLPDSENNLFRRLVFGRFFDPQDDRDGTRVPFGCFHCEPEGGSFPPRHDVAPSTDDNGHLLIERFLKQRRQRLFVPRPHRIL